MLNINKGIGKYLDCSTVHLDPVTMEHLIEGAYDDFLTCHTYAEGAWVSVFVDEDVPTDEVVPSDLFYVMRFAIANECHWIKFDRDGEVHSELYKFQWK